MPSVALVVLDTLRKDAFDAHFDWLPGLRFENAYSPSHRTPPVHAALFCGQYPSELGVYTNSDSLDCGTPTIAENLSEHGVHTAGFSANPYITRHFGFERGFDEFHTPWQLESLEATVFDWQSFAGESSHDGLSMYLEGIAELTRSDKPFGRSLAYGAKLFLAQKGLFNFGDDGAREATELLESRSPDDEFLFVNLMEAHEPYNPPRSYRTSSLSGFPTTVEVAMHQYDFDPEEVRSAYDDSVRYLSDQYRELFSRLVEKYDYVITCADHGELFDKDGLWGHFFGLYPELTHVPLVVSGDGVSDERVGDVVSLLDVHRTVLDLFDVEAESRGRNLLENPGDTYLTECHGIAQKRLDNLGHDEDALARAKQYDRTLTGMASPVDYYGYETVDGYESSGESVHDDPRSTQDELLSELNVREGDEVDVSGSVQNRLEDLGYM